MIIIIIIIIIEINRLDSLVDPLLVLGRVGVGCRVTYVPGVVGWQWVVWWDQFASNAAESFESEATIVWVSRGVGDIPLFLL